MNNHKLIIALDNLSESEARSKIEQISSECSWYMDRIVFKVNDLLADIWLRGVDEMFKWVKWGIMLDPKWHDIQNTTINYIKKLWNYDLWNKAEFVTIHASSWYEALKKAVETRNSLWMKTKIFAITALTTLDDLETNKIFDETSKHSVLKLAKEALQAWVDGIVCSPMEAQILRDVYRDYNFEIITPWVRFYLWDKWDQKRITTPKEAINQGSNHIVMWRPILWSENLKDTVNEFFDEICCIWYDFFQESNISKDKNEFERLLYTGSFEELLRYIWAFYNRIEWWKYCRLASWLLSNAYINIWAIERNYLVLQRAANEIASEIKNLWLEADVVIWAQMGSVRMSLLLAEKLGIEDSIYTEKWWENDKEMMLKRHDIDLRWKKVILSEDIITKWSTLTKMMILVWKKWWQTVGISCVWNRYWKNNFEWIPIISCYNPPEFKLYYDENTPQGVRWNYPKIPKWSQISEKPKNDWDNLVRSMRS